MKKDEFKIKQGYYFVLCLFLTLILIIATVSCSSLDKPKTSNEAGVSLAGGIVNKEEETPSDMSSQNTASNEIKSKPFEIWSFAEIDKNDSANESIFAFITTQDTSTDDRFAYIEIDEHKDILIASEKILFGSEVLGETIGIEKLEEGVYFDIENMVYMRQSGKLSKADLKKIANFEARLTIAKWQISSDLTKSLGLDSSKAIEDANTYIEGAFASHLNEMQAFVYYVNTELELGIEPYWSIEYIKTNEIQNALDGSLIDRYYVDVFVDSGKIDEVWRERTTLEQLLSGDNKGIFDYESSGATLSIDAVKNDPFWRQDAFELIEDIFNESVNVNDVVLSRFDGKDEIIVRVGLNEGNSYRVYYSLIERLPTKIKFSKALPPQTISHSDGIQIEEQSDSAENLDLNGEQINIPSGTSADESKTQTDLADANDRSSDQSDDVGDMHSDITLE